MDKRVSRRVCSTASSWRIVVCGFPGPQVFPVGRSGPLAVNLWIRFVYPVGDLGASLQTPNLDGMGWMDGMHGWMAANMSRAHLLCVLPSRAFLIKSRLNIPTTHANGYSTPSGTPRTVTTFFSLFSFFSSFCAHFNLLARSQPRAGDWWEPVKVRHRIPHDCPYLISDPL